MGTEYFPPYQPPPPLTHPPYIAEAIFLFIAQSNDILESLQGGGGVGGGGGGGEEDGEGLH